MVQRIATQVTAPDKEDSLANLIGQFGRWQFLVFATVSLVKLSSGWVQMAILFLTPKLTFWCVEFRNGSASSAPVVENSTCYSDCLKYDYDASPFDNTIVSEWDLVCERGWLASFTQMVLQLGILLGSIVFGFLSDRYGRKITFLISITFLVLLGFAIPFAPNYATFTVIRFFWGVATSGTMVVSFVIVMETIGSNYREMLGCLFQIPFIIGHMTVPLFAYYFRSWDSYSLAMAVPPLIYLMYFISLTESPRWLLSVGRVDEAAKIVKKAAQFNGLPTTKIDETLKQLSDDIRSKSQEGRANYTDLLRPALLVKTVCCCVMWTIVGLTFYGFNQYISQTSPDPFVTVAAAGAIQIPSNIISIWLIKRFGRKLTIALTFILGGICVLLLGVVPKTYAITLTLGTLGVSCTAIVAASIYIYTSELFPTVVRNMSMGACSMCMRIGSMIAPFISNLALTVPWLPTVVFGFAAIAASAMCLFLPETKGTTLPDSLEDVSK
ncbi:organic cation transporter-like protein [Pieris brassicae]|uniref:organic cation transporter-like protein n=1 Tax=Pieris brassicae TaxID=7116 RepID=UPI001E65E50B|nr:organic cation transporter-like protein [Pieris brassicae]XP_045518257.1 organic cation transporter-like protein [Pieris brassicae]XP_045518258.1 organic cation transporter-like protein [Pieris brassicae]